MPILLWYLPFTMFSSACDLVFSEAEMQLAGGWPAGSSGPAEESDDSDQLLSRRPARLS
jgi:hypothetical protein